MATKREITAVVINVAALPHIVHNMPAIILAKSEQTLSPEV